MVRSAGDELAEPMSLALGHLEEEGCVVLGLKLVGCGDGILSHDGSPFRGVPLLLFPSLRGDCRVFCFAALVTHLFREGLSVQVLCVRSLPHLAKHQHP